MRNLAFSVLVLLLLASSAMAQIPDPETQRRSTSYWELEKYRQILYDEGTVIRGNDGNLLEVWVSDAMSSDDIIAWNDSLKYQGGGTMIFTDRGIKVDTTIYFGPNTLYMGIRGDDGATQDEMYRSEIMLNPGVTNHHMDLFAPDPEYLDRSLHVPYGCASCPGGDFQVGDDVTFTGGARGVIKSIWSGTPDTMNVLMSIKTPDPVNTDSIIENGGDGDRGAVTGDTRKNKYTGDYSLGYIRSTKWRDLRISVNTDVYKAPISASMAGIRAAGVLELEISNNRITNFLFPIISTANECDSLFFQTDGNWETKNWFPQIFGNTIANTGYTNSTHWDSVAAGGAGGRDTMKAYGGAGITLAIANGADVYGNSIAFSGGPAIWVPMASSINIHDNGIENGLPADTLNPWVIVGFWDTDDLIHSPTDVAEWADYDSTHLLVNSEFTDCAVYNYVPAQNDLKQHLKLRNVKIMNNRIESNRSTQLENLFIGWNAKATEVYGNNFSRNLTAGEGNNYPCFTDKGEATLIGNNSWPHGGRAQGGAGWGYTEKSLNHAMRTRTAGGEIFLGPYTYYIDFDTTYINPDGYIEVPSNTHLVGVPGVTRIKISDGFDDESGAGPPYRYNWFTFRGMFNIGSNDSNITIENIIFDGNTNARSGVNNNNEAAIGIGHRSSNNSAKNIEIRNCEFIGWNRSIWIKLDNNAGNKIDGLNIHHNIFRPRVHVDGTSHQCVAFDIDVVLPDTIAGMQIVDNKIIDGGISVIWHDGSNDPNKYNGRFPVWIVPNASIYHSVIDRNFVSIESDTTWNGSSHSRVDTMWVDYDYSGTSVGYADHFYDVGAMYIDTMKVGTESYGDHGETPSYVVEDVTASNLGPTEGGPAMAIGSDGEVHIAYFDSVSITDTDLMYVSRDPNTGVFSSPVAIDEGPGGGASYVKSTGLNLLVDSNDIPHVFYENTQGAVGRELIHAYQSGASWILDSTGLGGVEGASATTYGGTYHNDRSASVFNYATGDTFFVSYIRLGVGTDSLYIAKGVTGSWADKLVSSQLADASSPTVYADTVGDIHVTYTTKGLWKE
jgi:hypothetical protein